MCENMHTLAANVLLGRWCMTVDLLGQVFTETLGKDALSIFAQQRTFETIEREFRREMDHLRSCVHRDLPMEVSQLARRFQSKVGEELLALADSTAEGEAPSHHFQSPQWLL